MLAWGVYSAARKTKCRDRCQDFDRPILERDVIELCIRLVPCCCNLAREGINCRGSLALLLQAGTYRGAPCVLKEYLAYHPHAEVQQRVAV